jgi:hypothetical protein
MGAQGMNAGIQDAFNLGWKLGLVASEAARPDLLDSYEAERMPIDASIIRWTDRGTRLMLSTGSTPHFLLRQILSNVTRFEFSRRRLVEVASQIAACYRNSTVVEEHGLAAGPRAGDRAFDGALRSVKSRRLLRLFDLFVHTRHTLLILWPGDFEIERFEAQRSLFNVHRINEVDSPSGDFVDYAGTVALHYGLDPAAYLIRPDGYVAFRCRLSDVSRLLPAYLRRVFSAEGDVQLKVA